MWNRIDSEVSVTLIRRVTTSRSAEGEQDSPVDTFRARAKQNDGTREADGDRHPGLPADMLADWQRASNPFRRGIVSSEEKPGSNEQGDPDRRMVDLDGWRSRRW